MQSSLSEGLWRQPEPPFERTMERRRLRVVEQERELGDRELRFRQMALRRVLAPLFDHRLVVRRKALDDAANALQPSFKLKFPKFEGVRSRKKDRKSTVTSQSASQSTDLEAGVRDNN
jgi:hypothetical protein